MYIHINLYEEPPKSKEIKLCIDELVESIDAERMALKKAESKRIRSLTVFLVLALSGLSFFGYLIYYFNVNTAGFVFFAVFIAILSPTLLPNESHRVLWRQFALSQAAIA